MVYFGKVDLSDRKKDEYESAVAAGSHKKEVELSEDFILPDYMRDAKKIVWVKGRPVITDQYRKGEGLSVSGKVIYDILYIDELGAASGVSFESAFSLDCEDKCTGASAELLRATLEAVSAHLSNPRKLNLRSRAGIVLDAWEKESFLPTFSGAGVPECRVMSAQGASVGIIFDDTLTFSADARIESPVPTPDGITDVSADVFFERASVAKGQAQLEGRMNIKVLLSCPTHDEKKDADAEDGAPETEVSMPAAIAFSYPLKLSLDAKDIKDAQAAAIGSISSVNASLAEDEEGNMRLIEFDVDYSVSLLAVGEKEILYIDDAFIPGAYTSLERTSYSLPSPDAHLCGSFSLSEGVEIAQEDRKKLEGAEAISSYIRLSFPEEREVGKRDRTVLSGKAHADMLMRSIDGELFPYGTTIPLRTECAGTLSDASSLFGSACADMAKIRIDDGKIRFDFEVRYDFMGIKESTIDAVSAIKAIKDIERSGCRFSGIVIAYPESDETIFDLCKKYSLPCEALLSENGIDEAAKALPRTLKIPEYSDKKPFSAII